MRVLRLLRIDGFQAFGCPDLNRYLVSYHKVTDEALLRKVERDRKLQCVERS